MDAIRTNALTKYYGKTRGIEGLDLTVREGEFFGFIGPNGAGKSTTIRTLLGLISPTSGSAFVLGMDILRDRRNILASVGYLPSEVSFYPGMKVGQIIRLSADLRKKNCEKEAADLCARLQLDVNKNAGELSYGNKKKVAIVCALQSDPRLLILDEPTGGLDPLMQHEFFEILEERNRRGVTVFLSSHVLPEVRRSCARAAIIRAGSIVACDSVEKLSDASAKRVTVRGRINAEGLPGVSGLTVSGDETTFLYSGDMGRLVTRLSEGTVLDLTVSEPDLEEVFLHYYEKEGKNA